MLSCLSAVMKTYAKGEYIFKRESRITSVAMLLEGVVHIQQEDYWGNLSILSEVSQGEIFGEVYACLGSEEMQNNAGGSKIKHRAVPGYQQGIDNLPFRL